MWEQDWALLGIAPTTELAAIKKAYALKLKITRPDDDAQAYQALRAAYERVQQWLKWQREQSPAEEAPAPPPSPASAAPEPVASRAQEPDAAWVPEPADPQAWVDELHALWRQQGAPAVVAHWPQTRALLETLPLSQRAAGSARFAHWVLQHPTLPDALLTELVAYFDWLGDYQVERQLGPALAQALQVALHGRLVIARPPSPQEQDRVKPLLQFKRLRQQERGGLRLLLMLALQPMLIRLLHGFGLRTLGQLGFDLYDQRELEKLGHVAWTCRAAAFLAAAAAIFAVRSPFLPAPGELAFFWALVSLLWLASAHYLGLFMHYGFSFVGQSGTALALPLARWRRHRWQPRAGLAMLALAAALGMGGDRLAAATAPFSASEHLQALAGWAGSMLPWLLCLVATLLAWPLAPAAGTLSMGLAMPLFVGLVRTELAPWSTCLAASLLYVLAGAAVVEGRLALGKVPAWLFQPVINTLAAGMRWGWRFALLPGLLALACAFGRSDGTAWMATLPVWIALTLALSFGQSRLEAWALEHLNRA